MYEPEPIDWVALAQIAGALSPFLLLFLARVRAWLGKQWRRVVGQKASRAELAAMRDEISGQLTAGFAKFHRELESVSDQIRQVLVGIGDVSSRTGIIESMLRYSADQDATVASVFCDQNGEITFASRALGDWMDCDRSELMGWRWLRFVQQDQRAMVREEIRQAGLEHREALMDLNMGPDGKDRRPYRLVLAPMPEERPLQAWAGQFRPIGRNPYITDRPA